MNQLISIVGATINTVGDEGSDLDTKIGGVGYMTSSGDAGKVKKAKDTILYGVIGLVIVALSFAIVNFVISSIISQG